MVIAVVEVVVAAVEVVDTVVVEVFAVVVVWTVCCTEAGNGV